MLVPLVGKWADRVGAMRLYMMGCLGFLVMAYPIFYLLSLHTLSSMLLVEAILCLLLSLIGGSIFPLIMKNFPVNVRFNPEITVLTDETDGYWEGCLSVLRLRGFVERPTHIAYRGYDLQGTLIEREAKGFHARTVQHEMDHLDGILFPARLKNLKLLAFEDEAGFQELKRRISLGESFSDRKKAN